MRTIGSVIFAVASILAATAVFNQGGLVMYVEEGQPEFFKDSTGSIAGQDEYLLFIWLLVPSALIRLVRHAARPAIVELIWFAFAVWVVYLGFSSVGIETFRQTFDATGDRWLMVELAATGIAIVTFCALAAAGWLVRRST